MTKDDILGDYLADLDATIATAQADLAAIIEVAAADQAAANAALFAAIDAGMAAVAYQWEPPEVWGDKTAWWELPL